MHWGCYYATATALDIEVDPQRCCFRLVRKAFTPSKVEQITLVIRLLGSIEESRWRQSLEAFGMTRSQQDKIIRRCMVATLEDTHLVLGVGYIGLSTVWGSFTWSLFETASLLHDDGGGRNCSLV